MKLNKIFIGIAALALTSIASCTDQIAFGDAALDKASSSTATIDTVFNNPEYARQFVTGIYSKQYYGLPYYNVGTKGPHAANPYAGKWDGLTDCWHQFWNGAAVFGQYYTGALTTYVTRDDGLDGPLYNFTKEFQWWGMRAALIFLDNIDRVPDMTQAEKNRLSSECRCLYVSYFWETFQNYGGIPIMDHALESSETSNEMPRDTVDKCVDWMVNMLDQAIKDSDFPWVTSDPTTMSGRWTKAGAMALKCKILQFAASPMLNPKDGLPYYSGASADVKPFIMYQDASKYQERWDRFATACDEFYNALQQNGYYELTTAAEGTKGSNENNVPLFRLAYRRGYFLRESREILHSVRVMGQDNSATARYCWHSWYSASVPRNAYCPSHEYVTKFPYYDGEPFNWENAASKTYQNKATEPEFEYTRDANGEVIATYVTNFLTNSKTGAITRNKKSLHTMFVRGSIPTGSRQLNTVLTRDPRLYEECIVNGQPLNLDWTTGSMSGLPWELWYNGNDGGTGVFTQTNTMFGSGYGFNKYYLGAGGYQGDTNGDNYRYQTQWVALSLAEFYLQYAEALVMRSNKDVDKAVQMVDIVRSRVGLPSMKVVWTNSTNRAAIGYKASSPAEALNTAVALGNGAQSNEFIEELLDERVRELGLTNARWFDMIRFKRTDWMTKQLHGILQHRVVQEGANFLERDKAWVGADRDNDPSSTQPLDFVTETVDITGNKRNLWGQDPLSDDVRKWLLSPIPQSEINKQYGLVQNPGW